MLRNNQGLQACRIAVALAIVVSTVGCTDYLARRETLNMHSGEAMAYNRAIHIIDPWPAASANTTIPADGIKIQKAIERYRNGDAAAPDAAGAGAAQPPAATTGSK
jgi:hypothetical protein